MGHVPSLCVLLNPCYSRWCYGQILAIAPQTNVWERIGEKHLAQLVGEGACQPDILTKYRLGCELSYGPCPISLCAFKPLLFKVVLWPNFGHCTTNVWERIGEKHLAQLVGEGACQPDILTKYRLGCELSYGSCPISLCAL